MRVGQLNTASSAPAEGMSDLAKAMTVHQAEWMRLVSRRGQAYLSLPATVAKCRSPQDIFFQQQAFMQQCAQDYVAAAQSITAGWGMLLPLHSAITGLGDTVNDESLNSAPKSNGSRDVMAVDASDTRARSAGSEAAASRQAA